MLERSVGDIEDELVVAAGVLAATFLSPDLFPEPAQEATPPAETARLKLMEKSRSTVAGVETVTVEAKLSDGDLGRAGGAVYDAKGVLCLDAIVCDSA
jgi:hypothetical protein